MTSCPLWLDNDRKLHDHGDVCCKEVNCPVCKNQWCAVGNPKVREAPFNGKAPFFEGYINMDVKGVTICYVNVSDLLNKKNKNCDVHDPMQDGTDWKMAMQGDRVLFRR